MKFTGDIFEKLFVIMTLGLNTINMATYVAGRKVYDRNRDRKYMYAADIDAAQQPHAPQESTTDPKTSQK